MKILNIKPTFFADVKIIEYARFPDSRGFFTETFRKSDLLKINLPGLSLSKFEIVQSNLSYSNQNVIRGLHFQWNPNQSKLVRVVEGEIIDFFLDIRKNSPTFGKIDGVRLESHTGKLTEKIVWIPFGFAHGFAAKKNSYVEYFCDAEYAPGNEASISPFAPDIDWSALDRQLKKEFDLILKNSLVTEKDKKGFTVSQWKNK